MRKTFVHINKSFRKILRGKVGKNFFKKNGEKVFRKMEIRKKNFLEKNCRKCF
jgi:hypothetical protein